LRRQVALADFKLAHAPAEGLADRRPVLRHEFLRAPLRRTG
jgi:hypothetical protein